MPQTKTEKLIRHKRRRSGLLVPLLEDLFQKPVEIEDAEDVAFIVDVLTSQIARSEARVNKPLFSPSQLASCLRYVYLLKHHRELGIERLKSMRVEPHFYFFNGNFLHLKWQFALWKLHRSLPDKIFGLHGVEVPIISKRGDHGGTVDGLCSIYEEPLIVDFKGLNVRTFSDISRGNLPVDYALQIGDYGMLFNSAVKNGKVEITRGLLVAESKGGPDPKHLIALHETEVEISVQLPEVRRRLKELRKHGEEGTIPPPECTSTGSIQFLGCPFRKFCKEEVKEIQRQHRESEREDSARLSVAVPNGRGNHSSRGNSKRRRPRTS